MAEISVFEEPEEPRPKGRPSPLRIAWGVTGIAVLWTGIFCAIVLVLRAGVPPVSEDSVSDLATLVFGTSGVSLAIFSLLVGGAAIAGWNTIKESVRNEIEASIKARIEVLDKEMRGRQLAGLGMVLGLFYARGIEEAKGDERARRERESYLEEVVGHCWKAYRMLKEIDSLGQYMALNNFVFFSCLRGGPSTQSFILQKARELKSVGEERSYWDALLTYCLAVARFGDTEAELKDALKLASELKLKEGLTARQREEAAATAASLTKRLANQVKTGEDA